MSRFESSQDDSITHVSHNVTNFEFLYEPFYVSLDSGKYDYACSTGIFVKNTNYHAQHMDRLNFVNTLFLVPVCVSALKKIILIGSSI